MFDEIYEKLIKSVSVGNLIENEVNSSVSDDMGRGISVEYSVSKIDNTVQSEVDYWGINRMNLAEQLSLQLEAENRRYNRIITT